MTVEMHVGLHVTDDIQYQKYRDEMLPILKSFGGGFGYDFKVVEVLKSETEQSINRTFTIFFENQEAMSNFFANEEYQEIKTKYFETSVSSTTIISTYER